MLVALENPRNANALTTVRLFAVLGTWMEVDIVSSTVQNAIAQGCERVYLVDNNSCDETVEVACKEGATLARSFSTDRYDESLRLRHMNDVVTEVSVAEGDERIWWLFLDADEFHHGPSGMTLRQYLSTLDVRFRVVGARFFDHYPNGAPELVLGRHPLDFQPLCEELAYPMCPSGHRKHPLQRYDKGAARIECGPGFHQAHCLEQLYEPLQPVFLHHFPYRREEVTRRKLEQLWGRNDSGATRAVESRDTHMLARLRSIDAVYAQDWAAVQNFIALDPMYEQLDPLPPPFGVALKPWEESVEPEHQPVLRWYSTIGAWNYENLPVFQYGDDVSYGKGIAFLDGHGTIEDWGCGFAHARTFITHSKYVGLDGSSRHADKIVDLSEYTSDVDCILMRHVLEHNVKWQRILMNAVASFKKRMALIVFTPFSDATRVIAAATHVTSVPIPDISFKKEDLTDCFVNCRITMETLETETQYGIEHVFYVEK